VGVGADGEAGEGEGLGPDSARASAASYRSNQAGEGERVRGRLFVAAEGVAEAGEPAFVVLDFVAAFAGVFGR
jgi:hypothetical protein